MIGPLELLFFSHIPIHYVLLLSVRYLWCVSDQLDTALSVLLLTVSLFCQASIMFILLFFPLQFLESSPPELTAGSWHHFSLWFSTKLFPFQLIFYISKLKGLTSSATSQHFHYASMSMFLNWLWVSLQNPQEVLKKGIIFTHSSTYMVEVNHT